MALATQEHLTDDEQQLRPAERDIPSIGLSDQSALTWHALNVARISAGTQTEAADEQRFSTFTGMPIPVSPVQHTAPTEHDVDLGELFGLPELFNKNELSKIFSNEIRTHDNDGGPLSVYFGPTRISMLADVAIARYGEKQTGTIHQVAKMVTDAYMAKF